MTTTKTLAKLFFFLLCSSSLFGQDWFPLGASWTYVYGVPNGPELYQATVQVTEQTNEGGLLISKMELTADAGAFGQCQALTLPLYTYTVNDSVLYATAADSTYRLAFITNATVGQSWHIAASSIHGLDSSLVEVISAETINADGTMLQQFTCEVIAAQGSFEIPSPTVVMERVGSLSGLLFPLGLIASCDAITPPQLMCYQDASLNYLSTGFESCILSSSDKMKHTGIHVYPNPAFRMLNYTAEDNVSAIHIFNSLGQEVMSVQPERSGTGSIDLSRLSTGMYIASFQTKGASVPVRVVVQH